MKNILPLLSATLLLGTDSLCAAPCVSNVICRQQWPWSRNIHVDYTLAGMSGTNSVDITVTASNNTQGISIDEAAISGFGSGLTADGKYRLVIDPAKVPDLVKLGYTENLTLTLGCKPASSNNAEVLYKVVDLDNGTIADITRGQILGGGLGTFETNCTWISKQFFYSWAKDQQDLVWTEVTNDASYSTDKLVLRKIPAAYKKFYQIDSAGATKWYPVHVILTEDFYIGVFEITQAQWAKVMGSSASLATASYPGPRHPQENVSYPLTRESADNTTNSAYSWPGCTAVHPESFAGRLNQKVSNHLLFDLPTEAQLYFAGQGGAGTYNAATTTLLNNGYTNYTGTVKNDVYNLLARNTFNGGTENGTAIVGSYQPNLYGLYDIHGNVREWCLDWKVTFVNDSSVTNPPGATSQAGAKRLTKGGAWNNSNYGGLFSYRDGEVSVTSRDAYTGFRIKAVVPSQNE